MKKALTLFIAASFLYLHPYAQKAQVNWSELEKNSAYLLHIFKGHDNELITLSITGRTPLLTRYDSNLKQIDEKKPFNEKMDVHTAATFKDNLFIFSSEVDRDDNFAVLRGARIDQQTLQAGSMRELARFDHPVKRYHVRIGIKASDDTSHILVFGDAPFNREENEKFFVNVFDNKMNKLWEKVIDLPYPGKLIDVEDVKISNEGEVYILCRQYEKEMFGADLKNHAPSNTYKIYGCSQNENTLHEMNLTFRNSFVHSASLQFNKDGNIFVMGMYQKVPLGWVNGCFMYAIDKNLKHLLAKKMESFPADSLLTYMIKDGCANDVANNPGLNPAFKIIGTNKRNDGSIDLLTEYNLVTYHTSASINSLHMVSVSDQPQHSAYDILVINFKEDGKIVYTRVPKKQEEYEFGGQHVSFKWMNLENKLVLFYNDNRENIATDPTGKAEPMKDYKKSVFVVAAIDEKGALQKQMVFSNDELDLSTLIFDCVPLNENTLGLYASKKPRIGKTEHEIGVLKLQ